MLKQLIVVTFFGKQQLFIQKFYTPSGHYYKQNLHFRFIQLMMYMVFIIHYIYHLMNETKILIFAYNCDHRVYLILNVQVSIQNLYFKLLNMCKFAHYRKTLTLFIYGRKKRNPAYEKITIAKHLCNRITIWKKLSK